MQVDRPVITEDAGELDEPLAFAEAVDAHEMRALRATCESGEEAGHLVLGPFVTKHRQRKGRLRYEHVARHALEGPARGIGGALVIAGDDGAFSVRFDDDLS